MYFSNIWKRNIDFSIFYLQIKPTYWKIIANVLYKTKIKNEPKTKLKSSSNGLANRKFVKRISISLNNKMYIIEAMKIKKLVKLLPPHIVSQVTQT